MPYTDMYEIQDNDGTIYSGSKQEIEDLWDRITYDRTLQIDFSGDLRLVRIVETWNG